MPLRCPLLAFRANLRLRHRDQTPREVRHALKRRSGLWGSLRGHRFFLRPRSRCLRLLALRRSGAQIRACQVAVGDATAHDISPHTEKWRALTAAALIDAAHLLINTSKELARLNA